MNSYRSVSGATYSALSAKSAAKGQRTMRTASVLQTDVEEDYAVWGSSAKSPPNNRHEKSDGTYATGGSALYGQECRLPARCRK